MILFYSLSQTCSCRVHGYSFWIGLLVPFGVIYIMNWVIFILIFASLLCRPNARKEMGDDNKLRKLKENFMIALGLSLLFGLGWAVGLLASSDLPDAVRYLAGWIFTLLNAFLGVYLFALYVVRSPEARNVWKRCILCERWICCESRRIDHYRSSTRKRWTSTIGSWVGTFKQSETGGKDTDTLTRSANLASANVFSFSNPSGRISQIDSSYAKPSSVTGVTTPTSPSAEIELLPLHPDGQSNNEEMPKSVTLPILQLSVVTESVVETMDCKDNFSLLSFNSPSVHSTSSVSQADADCIIVDSKETDEGPDYIPL